MISLDMLMDIICTEAIEHGGLQEVPDRADGTVEHYHSLKRNARADGELDNGEQRTTASMPPIQYDLELIESDDGTIKWVE